MWLKRGGQISSELSKKSTARMIKIYLCEFFFTDSYKFERKIHKSLNLQKYRHSIRIFFKLLTVNQENFFSIKRTELKI